MSMNRFVTRSRAAWMGVATIAIVGLVALAPHLGYTTTSAPIWSERPVPAAPAAGGAHPNRGVGNPARKPALTCVTVAVSNTTPRFVAAATSDPTSAAASTYPCEGMRSALCT